ncbi:hypothetical protein [Mycobacterium sp.]|uniref:hypothetical protein n=1 Tax=Mycobacterium sp. TaxID=1785 RepID=UPI0031DFDD66
MITGGLTGETPEVDECLLVESQRTAERVDDGRRRVVIATLFEAGVVGGAHAGRRCELFAA